MIDRTLQLATRGWAGLRRGSLGGLVLFLGLVIGVGLWVRERQPAVADSNRDGAAQVGWPLLDEEARGRLGALSDPKWSVREEASTWLVLNPDRWLKSYPAAGWDGSPEARWRVRRAIEVVCALEDVPNWVAREPWEVVAQRSRGLHREYPEAFERALLDLFRAPSARLRQRGVEILGLMPIAAPVCCDWLRPLFRDVSAWVRVSVYRLAATLDPDFTEGELRQLLAKAEPDELAAEVIKALRELGRPVAASWLRPLWNNASFELRVEIGLALCQRSDQPGPEVLQWMLRAGDPSLVLPALRKVRESAPTRDLEGVCELLSSPYGEVRRAVFELVDRFGSPVFSPWVVPHLASEDVEVVCRVIQWLTRWRAEDYYAEVEAALQRLPVADRPVRLVADEGAVRVEPAHAPR
ncbi:MAG: HEAT repeat domain-containing protein [Planctomycetota bacterium]